MWITFVLFIEMVQKTLKLWKTSVFIVDNVHNLVEDCGNARKCYVDKLKGCA